MSRFWFAFKSDLQVAQCGQQLEGELQNATEGLVEVIRFLRSGPLSAPIA